MSTPIPAGAEIAPTVEDTVADVAAPVTGESVAAAPEPTPDTPEAQASRLEAATTQVVDSDAVHALLVEVIDAAGSIRNGLLAGEHDFAAAFAHAKAALESAAGRFGH